MKHAKKIYLTTALVLALAFTGCNQNEQKAETAAPESQPAAAQATQESKESAMPAQASAEASVPAAGQPEATATQGNLTGAVVETFDSGGYTYIQLDTGTSKVWAAIGQTKVAVGDKISLLNGPVMRDFHSKSLDRTFPEIIFSAGLAGAAAADPHAGMGQQSFSQALQGEGGTAMPPGAMGMGAAESSGGSGKAITPLQEIKVDKAEGANGYQVGEVFASAADLAGKKVKIRGKVVKVSPGIMGRTWIHLQDGTGDPAKNTHDLVVTSADVPELNSIIMIEGDLAKDKDFGAGYFYNVIVEGATVSK